jgi:ClpP class serine protease
MSGNKIDWNSLTLLKPKTSQTNPFFKYDNGIVVIPLFGYLTKYEDPTFDFIQCTAYSTFNENVLSALVDPTIKEIVIVSDSRGGDQAGSGEAAEIVNIVNEIKPVTVIVRTDLLSAAYEIASAAGPSAGEFTKIENDLRRKYFTEKKGVGLFKSG